MPISIKAVDEDKHTLQAVFSNDKQDRHGDVVLQNWDLKSFKKNPVILNSHNYYDATEVIGKATKIKVVDNQLEGEIEFAVGANPRADVIFELYKGGFLNAFSVGFIPLEFSAKGEIIKSELLEVSAVSIPANTYALAKAKGINVSKLYEDNQTNGDDGGEETGDDDEGEESDEETITETGDGSETDGVDGGKDTGKTDDDKQAEELEVKRLADLQAKEKEYQEKKKQAEAELLAKAEKTKQTFNKIAEVIDGFCEGVKVETHLLGGIAIEKRSINRAIRQLIKLKSKV